MRNEYKYLIPNNLLEKFKSEITPFLQLDKYADKRKEKEYTVRSIYLDSVNLNFYHEKIEGLRDRKKLRVRGYNNIIKDINVFLEIKRKYGSKVLKNRAPLLFDNLSKLLASGNLEKYILSNNESSDKIKDGSRFFHHLHRKSLVPTVLVVYDREAYLSKFNRDLRITLDKNLRYNTFPSYEHLFDNEMLKVALPNNFIVEVKFSHGFPNWLQKIIQRYEVSRMALSKYTICLDAEKHLRASRRRTTIGLLN